MSTTRHLTWTSAAISHVGLVRKINEDAYLDAGGIGLWAVADGMGGHEAGDVASQMIVDRLRAIPPAASLAILADAVQEGLLEVNQQLREESIRHYHNRTIGSTAAVLVAQNDHAACLWAGDSRIYRLRHGQLEQLTRDHSHVQDLVDRGLLTPEEAEHHPLSNVITRAVGSTERLDVDIRTLGVEPDDVFLLCSDGLTKMVSDIDIACLLNETDLETAIQGLLQGALDNGATDNVTVIVVRTATAL